MFRLGDALRVYLHRDAIDFRAGINTLCALVEQSMQLDAFAPAVFVLVRLPRTRPVRRKVLRVH